MSSTFDRLVKDLIGAMKVAGSPKTSPLDTTAEVIRVEDGIAWVHLPGGVDETPVSLTVAVSPGDTVQVRINSGKAWITGNATAPPTDDKKAIEAGKVAQGAQEKVNVVQEVAERADSKAKDALKLAEGTNEHFWHNETGAHITQVTQEEYEDDPANAGGNTLITSQGTAVRDGTTELASFTATGAQIGKSASGHTNVTEGGMQVWSGSDGTTELAHIGYDYGTPEGGGTQVKAPYFSFGQRATGSMIGNYSFSEGGANTASGYVSHAEGKSTQAIGDCAHAEGYYTVADGYCSHAGGKETVADQDFQTAIGKFNTKNNTNNLFVVGNGTGDTARSNAFEVSDTGGITAGGHPSGLLAEDIVIGDGLIVAAGQYGTGNVSITKSGYTPLGIVGIHLENATSGGIYNTYVFTHSWYISNGKAYFIFRNTYSADAKIKVTVTILYAKV